LSSLSYGNATGVNFFSREVEEQSIGALGRKAGKGSIDLADRAGPGKASWR
jgi:hypothetical protein